MPYDRQVAARANYNPDLQAYHPARHVKEKNWSPSTRNQSRKRAIERGANDYLLKLVSPTCLLPLKKRNRLLHQGDANLDAR